MLDAETRRLIAIEARIAGIEAAALAAIADVESGGKVFVNIAGRPEPLIRFEGHYFYRRLATPLRQKACNAGLASPIPGDVVNPASQAARWRLLRRAAAIDHKAAYESVSWGLGQVMGAHWAWLGYSGIDELVEDTRSGATGQIRLMIRFILKAGLAGAIRGRDWHALARGYNGPAYRKSSHHTRIARAYALYKRLEQREGSFGNEAAPADENSGQILSLGSRGEAVVSLQRMLTALGYPLAADGILGLHTERALRMFQRDHGIAGDGLAGPLTFAALWRSLRAYPFLDRLVRRVSIWFRALFSWPGNA